MSFDSIRAQSTAKANAYRGTSEYIQFTTPNLNNTDAKRIRIIDSCLDYFASARWVKNYRNLAQAANFIDAEWSYTIDDVRHFANCSDEHVNLAWRD